MPKPDTMLQRTKDLILVPIAVLCFAVFAFSQTTTSAPPSQQQNNQSQNQTQQAPAKPGQQPSPAELEGHPTQTAAPAAQQPANGQPPAQGSQQPQPQQQQTQPGGQLSPGELEGPPTQQAPAPGQPAAQQGQAPEKSEGDVFVFKKQVEEVQLHASVIDDKQHPVTNLDRDAFTVFEDGQPQRITSFRREDIPVALGILIDNSGSMRDKRAAVNQAALNLVRASNPQDEVLVVNFND